MSTRKTSCWVKDNSKKKQKIDHVKCAEAWLLNQHGGKRVQFDLILTKEDCVKRDKRQLLWWPVKTERLSWNDPTWDGQSGLCVQVPGWVRFRHISVLQNWILFDIQSLKLPALFQLVIKVIELDWLHADRSISLVHISLILYSFLMKWCCQQSTESFTSINNHDNHLQICLQANLI